MNYEIGEFFVKTIDVGFCLPLVVVVHFATNVQCFIHKFRFQRFAGLRVSRFPVGASVRRLRTHARLILIFVVGHLHRRRVSTLYGFSAYPNLQLPHNQNSRSILYETKVKFLKRKTQKDIVVLQNVSELDKST